MKKKQIVSLVLGSAAIVAGGVAYAAAKIAGRKFSSDQSPEEVMVNTPYSPDEADEVQGAHEARQEDKTVEQEELAAEQDAPEVEPEEQGEHDDQTAEQGEHDGNKPANLEEYIELNPEERENLEAVKDSFAADGVRTDISFVDNTMFFDFVMADVADEETREILKPDLEKFLEDQADTYRGIVQQIGEDTGFSDIKMIVIFMDEDGEQIVSGHYDENGRTL